MKEQTLIGKQPGVCPNCKSEDLDYDSSYPQDEYIIYPYTCKKCGKSGKEFYKTEFVNNIMISE